MSGRCSNLCAKTPRQVKMYMEDGKIIYLCRPCARELGYEEKP